MRKRNLSKASGSNDALFGGACLVAIIALGLCSSPAKAEEKTGPDVAFNAAVASDYVFRGVSQTESDPAVSAGVDVTQGLFYAGAWAGNVAFAGDADTDAEIDLYAGVRRVPLGDILAVVGADDYVELRLTNGRKMLHAARLDRLEAELPASFLRVHRSVIANLAHVRGFEREGGQGRLLMDEGASLPISRNRLPSVRDALDAAPRV